MKTDKELLELAAKAAGIPYIKPLPEYDGHLGLEAGSDNPMRCRPWNPLTDDGDALRLAVKLRMDVRPNGFDTLCVTRCFKSVAETHNADSLAATRRAIVRAAAAIGEKL